MGSSLWFLINVSKDFSNHVSKIECDPLWISGDHLYHCQSVPGQAVC